MRTTSTRRALTHNRNYRAVIPVIAVIRVIAAMAVIDLIAIIAVMAVIAVTAVGPGCPPESSPGVSKPLLLSNWSANSPGVSKPLLIRNWIPNSPGVPRVAGGPTYACRRLPYACRRDPRGPPPERQG